MKILFLIVAGSSQPAQTCPRRLKKRQAQAGPGRPRQPQPQDGSGCLHWLRRSGALPYGSRRAPGARTAQAASTLRQRAQTCSGAQKAQTRLRANALKRHTRHAQARSGRQGRLGHPGMLNDGSGTLRPRQFRHLSSDTLRRAQFCSNSSQWKLC
jgi:hypothetical protein